MRLIGRAPGRGAAVLVLGASVGLGLTGPVPGAIAATGNACGASGSSGALAGTNTTYDQLSIAAAAGSLLGGAGEAGRGVDVWVVDNGFPVWLGGTLSDPQDLHGTTVAGIVKGAPTRIAGAEVPVGIAPGVRMREVQAYASSWSQDSGDDGPTSGALAAALDLVRRNLSNRRSIVLVPYVVDQTPPLAKAVRQLAGRALIVAAGGDQPSGAGEPGVGQFFPEPDASGEAGTAPPGEDARGVVGPGASGDVLSVGAAGWSYPSSQVPLPNSDIDVAAPVGGGLSYGADGHVCVVGDVSTSWAAAEVAGVAALTWTAWPHLGPSALRERLERTADGGGQRQGNTTGFGVVQPLAAVTSSPSALAGAGPVAPALRRAVAPAPPADVLAKTRHTAVWWGLFGGGALIVALLLRPLLSRRR